MVVLPGADATFQVIGEQMAKECYVPRIAGPKLRVEWWNAHGFDTVLLLHICFPFRRVVVSCHVK